VARQSIGAKRFAWRFRKWWLMADPIIVGDDDWLRKSWDLPPYKSKEFTSQLKFMGLTLAQFKKLAVYKNAVEQGLIVDDKWAA
jgi:hypothetical protein